MGYSIELGKSDSTRQIGDHTEFTGFEVVKVSPFTGGSTQEIDPIAQAIYRELAIAPYEYGDDPLDYDESDLSSLPAVDDSGLVPASIAVTYNYSKRIRQVTGSHLGDLHGQSGAEGSTLLMELLSGLDPQDEYTDYWTPTDGNIKRLAETILDWTFQHPDATFRYLG